MQSRWMMAAGAALMCCGLSSPALANWSIHTLTNQTTQIISVDYPVNPGGTRTYGQIVGGDTLVAIPGFGVVKFVDKGSSPYCGPSWWVSITYNGSQWGMFYNGNGSVDMTVNANGTLTLTPGPATQIVNGSGPPACH